MRNAPKNRARKRRANRFIGNCLRYGRLEGVPLPRAPAGFGGEAGQPLVGERLEDGKIDGLGRLLARMPECLADRERLRRHQGGTADAPVVLGVVLAEDLAGGDDAGARLLVPRAAAFLVELR